MNKTLTVFTLSLLLALASAVSAYALESEDSVVFSAKDSLTLKVLFPCGRYTYDSAFSGNRGRVDAFFESLDSLAHKPGISIDNLVHIRSSASPEGGKRRNDFLSLKRAESLVSLYESKSSIASSFEILSIGPDWDSYNKLVTSSNFGTAKAQARFYPLLRQATLTLFYYRTRPKIAQVDCGISAPVLEVPFSGLQTRMWEATAAPQVTKPVLALKTNLLYDALTIANLGVEVPLTERVSLGADLMFPWWNIPSKDITLQLLAGELSARYWFGDRADKDPLTGLFAGLNAGAGIYDFQLGRLTDGRGVQGNVFLLLGLQAGYAHSIGKNLRLEYSLGLGYIQTEYREYISVKDTKFGDIKAIEYPWETKRMSGVLPSKLSVSLVWMISSKKGGGR